MLKHIPIHTNIAYYSNLEVIENLELQQNFQQASHCSASLVCQTSEPVVQDTAPVATCHQHTANVLTIALLANHTKNELFMIDRFQTEICDECSNLCTLTSTS